MNNVVKLTSKAKKQLSKFQKPDQQRIITGLERIRNRPRSFSKKLVNSDLSRFRVGNFRILIKIKDRELIILVIEIERRDKIYKDKS